MTDAMKTDKIRFDAIYSYRRKQLKKESRAAFLFLFYQTLIFVYFGKGSSAAEADAKKP